MRMKTITIFMLAVFVFSLVSAQTALAYSSIHDLKDNITEIYPKLDDGLYSSSAEREAVKLVLYEFGYKFENTKTLIKFYSGQSFLPLWLDTKKPGKKVKTALAVLQDSWSHGLNPRVYKVQPLKKVADSLGDQNSAVLRAVFEVYLSDSLISYIKDITGNRVDPASVGIDASHLRKPVKVQKILEQIVRQKDVGTVTNSLLPDNVLYEELRFALKRLVQTGHGGANKTFQANATYKNHHKIKQIIANLERLRWIDFKRPEKYIVINVPSARLWAISDNKINLGMPVVVGRRDRPTKSFVASIKGVRFNPSWTLPPSIMAQDILPKIQDNPDYLKENNITLYDGYGTDAHKVDPDKVNWQRVSSGGILRFKMVQAPGKDNPLGQVRFLMFNEFDIYLHDTNTPSLFSKPFRARRSGCVRV